MKAFFILLIAVLAALVLLFLILIGGACGALCDMIERAIRRIDRLGKWLAQPLKGEVRK